MTIDKIIGLLNARTVNATDATREINECYAGDFLSFVMGRAPSGCCWFTVMNNVNVIAVATLAEVGAVVLCEGVKATEETAAKARAQDVTVLETELDVSSAIRVLAGLAPKGI